MISAGRRILFALKVRSGNFPHSTMKNHAMFSIASLSLLFSLTNALALTVTTQSGRITGHRGTNRSSVYEYLGIPFAQPPLGDLRFASPQKYLPVSKSKPLIASTYVNLPRAFHVSEHTANMYLSQGRFAVYALIGKRSNPCRSDCPQTPSKPVAYPNATAQEERIVSYFANQEGYPQSEDCLYLNVWSKASLKQNKPVLVFFYGGSTYPRTPQKWRMLTICKDGQREQQALRSTMGNI